MTHSFQTGDITVLGHVTDVAMVWGNTISRIGAVEGQEQQNPAAIHLNFEMSDNPRETLVWMLNPSDAVAIGLQLVAMGIESQVSGVDDIRDRLSQLVSKIKRTLQVS